MLLIKWQYYNPYGGHPSPISGGREIGARMYVAYINIENELNNTQGIVINEKN